MTENILNNLNNPAQLEKLYRSNKSHFKVAFNALYPQLKENPAAQTWNQRLNFEGTDLNWGSRREILFVILAALLAGAIAKLPDFTSIEPGFFYPRNIAFVVFPLMTLYFAWKQKLPLKQWAIVLAAIIVSLFYINLLPDKPASDTLNLACIHMPLVLWVLTGYAFMGGEWKNPRKRLEYLRYNGDWLVMSALVGMAGLLFSGITVGLFSLLELPAEDLYFRYVGIWGMAAIPFVSAFLVLANPHLVSKVSPVIARIFTPIVLVTLIIYLVAVVITGKDPYNDREFLLMFNALLLGVMAIIFFSLTGTHKSTHSKPTLTLLFALSILTILVNGIALSAIVFRISEWGITPNRLAVLGFNLLILVHLLRVSIELFKALKNQVKIDKVEHSIVDFLPVYVVWVMLVSFILPFIFNFG